MDERAGCHPQYCLVWSTSMFVSSLVWSKAAMLAALKMGYRGIDTSEMNRTDVFPLLCLVVVFLLAAHADKFCDI